MLDWTQNMLAEQTGLSSNTIYSLEKGNITIRSQMTVRKLFEDKGFEFIGKSGVMRHDNNSRTYQGAEGVEKVYDAMLTHLREKGTEIAAIFKSQSMFFQALGENNASPTERMRQLGLHGKIKCLLTGKHSVSIALPSFEFRATQHHPFNPLAFIIFGNTTVIAVTKLINQHQGKQDIMREAMDALELVINDGLTFSSEQAVDHALRKLKRLKQ